jgi:hypothetical protein
VRDENVVRWIYEWDKGTPVHYRVLALLQESRKGNLYFELGEDPYVVMDLQNGARAPRWAASLTRYPTAFSLE